MLLALTIVDYAIVGFYLSVLLLIGWFFYRDQRDGTSFFLAGRALAWPVAGLSVAATIVSATGLVGLVGASYRVGLSVLGLLPAVWIVLPIVTHLVLPLYRGLQITSVNQYLDLRFGPVVRLAAGGVQLVWRLLWTALVISAPCALLAATGAIQRPTGLILCLGVVGTLYTAWGGMKAVAASDVLQGFALLLGLLIVLLAAAAQVDGGFRGIHQIAGDLQRMHLARFHTSGEASLWSESWLLWSVVPGAVGLLLLLHLADQSTIQRLLAARSLVEARRGALCSCVALSVLVVIAAETGIALVAFYHERPERMRAYWVVNAAPAATGDGLLRDPVHDRPWIEPRTDVRGQLESLVAAGAILDPITGDRLTQSGLLKDEQGELSMERLGTRDPIPNTPHSELRLRRGAALLIPTFLTDELATGAAALALMGLLAAAMSTMDSALHGMAAMVATDWFGRGRGRSRLARWRRREASPTPQDQCWLGRRLVVVFGAAATLLALAVGDAENLWRITWTLVCAGGGPLLGLFLLALLTCRAGAIAALTALSCGLIVAAILSFGPAAAPTWVLLGATAATLIVGVIVGLVAPRQGNAEELEGLVWGLGALGEAPGTIETAADEGDPNWR